MSKLSSFGGVLAFVICVPVALLLGWDGLIAVNRSVNTTVSTRRSPPIRTFSGLRAISCATPGGITDAGVTGGAGEIGRWFGRGRKIPTQAKRRLEWGHRPQSRCPLFAPRIRHKPVPYIRKEKRR